MNIFGFIAKWRARQEALKGDVDYCLNQIDKSKQILIDLQVGLSKKTCNFQVGSDYPLLTELFGHLQAIEEHLGIKVEKQKIQDPYQEPRMITIFKAIKK